MHAYKSVYYVCPHLNRQEKLWSESSRCHIVERNRDAHEPLDASKIKDAVRLMYITSVFGLAFSFILASLPLCVKIPLTCPDAIHQFGNGFKA